MTDPPDSRERLQQPRRTVLKASALASVGSALGLSTTGAAQEDEQTDGDEQDAEYQDAAMFNDEFRSGAIFRIASPPLNDIPQLEDQEVAAGWNVRIIEYFNTGEEAYVLVPEEHDLEHLELHVLGDEHAPLEDQAVGNLVEVTYRPLQEEDFPFDLEQQDAFDVFEGGGEAAVRPENFHAGALFRITSGPQGWVPNELDESGLFTDYQTHNAEYLGTDERFLFYPQGDAEVSPGNLYVMWDEFEFLSPVGNFVAAEFDPVEEDSIEIDDEFL